jgi:hypothetical protein
MKYGKWISDHLGPLEVVPSYQKDAYRDLMYTSLCSHTLNFMGQICWCILQQSLGNLDMLHTWK